MNYIEFKAGEKEYKLRLTTRAIVSLEKKINCNPIMIFGVNGDKVPSITDMVSILHASLQPLQHNITIEEAYGIFDQYLADGNTSTDFISVIIDIYKASGIIRTDGFSEGSEKN